MKLGVPVQAKFNVGLLGTLGMSGLCGHEFGHVSVNTLYGFEIP